MIPPVFNLTYFLKVTEIKVQNVTIIRHVSFLFDLAHSKAKKN
jgi:hypothetical protein